MTVGGVTVSVTPFGGGWSRRCAPPETGGHEGRRRLNPVAATGTIIEFYTQLEINKGGKLDDRLKDTGTNRPFASGTHARTPAVTPTGTVRNTPNALSTMNPRITPGVSRPSPRTPAPYHTTSDYLRPASCHSRPGQTNCRCLPGLGCDRPVNAGGRLLAASERLDALVRKQREKTARLAEAEAASRVAAHER